MHSNKVWIQRTVAAVLWTAVLAGGAWLAASHGRKEYADMTPVEILDGFTPTQVRAVGWTSLQGAGEWVFVHASARDGSFTMRVRKSAWDPAKIDGQEVWLEEVGPLTVQEPVVPGSDLSRAIQRNLRRAIATGADFQEGTEVALGAAH